MRNSPRYDSFSNIGRTLPKYDQLLQIGAPLVEEGSVRDAPKEASHSGSRWLPEDDFLWSTSRAVTFAHRCEGEKASSRWPRRYLLDLEFLTDDSGRRVAGKTHVAKCSGIWTH